MLYYAQPELKTFLCSIIIHVHCEIYNCEYLLQ